MKDVPAAAAASEPSRGFGLLLSLLVRWVLLAAAVVLGAWATPDAHFRGGPATALFVAVLIGLANVIAHGALRVLPKPSNLLVLATLTLVVNGMAIWIASAFTSSLHIGGFVPAVTFTLMVSVFSVALTRLAWVLLDRYERPRSHRS
ncbi:phage holin family protein [Nocardioides pacificus]